MIELETKRELFELNKNSIAIKKLEKTLINDKHKSFEVDRMLKELEALYRRRINHFNYERSY